eukprot:CAMPEP_0117583784 /NCGR_PEP_ID=MMETSP0784-20121206/67220_1 /TAXON_ID=39447 /ORGANISM="" /LENGTH=119 /DNA_ID=CAMNT_0005384535 /DNA_START=219 /DNA_END=575 /DNA_ORIENTATION=-
MSPIRVDETAQYPHLVLKAQDALCVHEHFHCYLCPASQLAAVNDPRGARAQTVVLAEMTRGLEDVFGAVLQGDVDELFLTSVRNRRREAMERLGELLEHNTSPTSPATAGASSAGDTKA